MPSAVGEGQPRRRLVCRAVEEVGCLCIGQPGFGADLVSLFATGPNPLGNSQSREEHLRWATDPLHSYIADGRGALCIWAHPHAGDGPRILALDGLTGLEVLYGHGSSGYAGDRDRLWDEVLTACYDRGRPFLWGFAADDTHDLNAIALRWYAALLPTWDEFALKGALREGACYVSTGPGLSAARVEGSAITLELTQPADIFWFRSGQFLDGALPHPMEVSREAGANRCLQADRGVTAAALDTAAFGAAAQVKFVRALIYREGSGVAFTQPFRLGDDRVGNPYPDSGVWVRGQTHNHTDSTPRRSNLPAYRAAYEQQGLRASFSLDYSYREYPYQWLPEDGTPQITSLALRRVRQGEGAELVVRGVNFLPGASVALNGLDLQLLVSAGEGELRALVPAGLPIDLYDVTVTTHRGLRDTWARGLIVHERELHSGWRSYTPEDGLAYPFCTSVARVGGEVWVTTLRGLSRLRDGRWSTSLPDEPWYAILADPDGGAWVAGDAGLVRFGSDGSTQRVRIGGAPGHDSPERWGRLALDRQGDLWAMNRWWAGLGVRQGGVWRRLTPADGTPSHSPTAVTCDAEGVLWMGFEMNGSPLYRLADGRWEAVPLPEPVAACSFVSVLAAAPDGSVWAALTHREAPSPAGVVRFNGGEATLYTRREGLPTDRIRDLLPTDDGSVWFASDAGVSCLERDGLTWSYFTAQNCELISDVVLGLAEGADGAIWCATAEGVSCYARSGERS